MQAHAVSKHLLEDAQEMVNDQNYIIITLYLPQK